MVGLFKSHAVALNGLYHLVDSGILSNNVVLKFYGHTLQADTLLLGHTLSWHTSHHRYNLCHLVGINHLSLFAFALCPALVQNSKLFLKCQLVVAITCCQFVVLILNSSLLLVLNFFQLFLLLNYLWWNLSVTKVYLRTCLVERVDGLIRHKAVGNVAVCQFDTGCQRLVSIGNVVMLLVAALYVVQNLQRFLVGCWFYLYLLETALKRTIFLYTLAIFVERCSTNALYCASSQCRFHYVGSVHRAWSRTCSDNGVNLVDKHNHIRICLQFLHKSLKALFKLSAILCTSHNTRHVERVDALTKQHRTCVALFYQLCQSFYYCALTNTWLTNQYWVVLLAAPQYLNNALNLALAAHTWVELTFSSSLREVCTKAV